MTQWSLSVVLVFSAVASVVVAREYAQPPLQCKKAMTAFCNGPALEQCIKVIKAKGGATPLVALFDSNPDHAAAAWRCYSPTSLVPDRSAYVTWQLRAVPPNHRQCRLQLDNATIVLFFGF
jgi:hypothetical protein